MPEYYPVPAETPTDDASESRHDESAWEKERRNSFMMDERKPNGRSIWATLRKFEHVTIVLLIIILLFNLWTARTSPITINISNPKGAAAATCAAESKNISGFVPNFPFNHPVEFNNDPSFETKYIESHVTNETWAYIMPRDGGWIKVQNPHQYGLAGGYPLKDGSQGFTIAMFHSLHCLRALQMAVTKLTHHKTVDLEHVDHCLNYIRHNVMCSADLTLERASKDAKDDPIHAVDGLGNIHMCRNFDDIVDWANEHGDGLGPMPGVTHWAGKDRKHGGLKG